jgi:hypothetical protein
MKPRLAIKGAAPVDVSVERTKNGAFRCEYTASVAGDYTIDAMLGDEPVRTRCGRCLSR